MSSEPPFWRGPRGRVLLGSLAGLVAAGIIIGLVIAWASTTVLEAAGLDTDATTRPPAAQQTTEPSETPTESETTTETTEPSEPSSSSTPPQQQQEPELTASPTAVSSMEQIDLDGRFPGLPAGTALQIERKEGGTWTLFPVSLSTGEGGSFSTYVQTGQSGPNQFRVTNPSSGQSTPVVTVRVGG